MASTFTILIFLTKSLFNLDVKNWDSNNENPKIVTIEMVSINVVLFGNFPEKYNNKGAPINVIMSADSLNI